MASFAQRPTSMLAEQMGHSPEMTVRTYTHVIRELKGLPPMGAEDQILAAREALHADRRGRFGDAPHLTDGERGSGVDS